MLYSFLEDIGDFNVNFYNSSYPLFSNLCNILVSLLQVVPEPTHISPLGSSVIDLALIYDPSKLLSCSVVPPLGASDHNGVQLSIKWRTSNHVGTKKRKIWKYNLTDFKTANSHLESFDCTSLLNGNIDQAWNNWKRQFLSIMDQCIPHTIVEMKHNLQYLG